jgi:starch phosphorylase
VDHPVRASDGPFRVGDEMHVTTRVFLGKLRPEEVQVELYYGILQSIDTVEASQIQAMRMEEDLKDGNYLYSCTIICRVSGRYGLTTRVTPTGDDRIKYTPGLITWA